jgi:hypothetical protein
VGAAASRRSERRLRLGGAGRPANGPGPIRLGCVFFFFLISFLILF